MKHIEHEPDRYRDEQLAELATLQEIGRQLHAGLEIDQVMQTALDWTMHITCALSGTISLLEQAETPTAARPGGSEDSWAVELNLSSLASSVAQGEPVLRVVAHRGYSPEMAPCWQTPWPTEGGLVGEVLLTGEAALLNDVPYTPYSTDDMALTTCPRSHLVAPIKRDNRMIGLICLESCVPGGFTIDHVSFLTRMTDLAAIAIENAQLYGQIKQRVVELESLRKTGLELTSSLDLETVLGSTLTHSQALTGADHVALSLYDTSREKLYHQRELWNGDTKTLSLAGEDRDPIAQQVAREAKAQVAYNGRRRLVQQDAARQMSAIACIPLIRSNGVLGVLTVSFQQRHALTQDKLRLLYLLADQAANAIENAQLYVEMQHAQDAKSDLIGAATQAFKAPMTSIQGYAKLIALQGSGPLTAQQQAYLEVIQKNVQRVNALVDNLIDISSTAPGPTLQSTENVARRAVSTEQRTGTSP